MKPIRCNIYHCKRKARATLHMLGWAAPLHYACVEHSLSLIKQASTKHGLCTVVVEWASDIFNPLAPDGNAGPLVTEASKTGANWGGGSR